MTRVLALIAASIAIAGITPARLDLPEALIPDMLADPSVLVIDGKFYCYGTTDGYDPGLGQSGPPVAWISDDFLNWRFHGTLFDKGFSANYWAPSTPVHRKGDYYLYPTLNGKTIGVVISGSPTGPFRNLDGTPVSPKHPARTMPIRVGKPIDAQVFVDDDGQAVMVWAERGIARLNPDLASFAGPQRLVSTKRQGYSEGPFLFKRGGVYYYLYTLGGNESYQYAYMMSRVSPLGPWQAPAQDIISTTDKAAGIYGPGHGSVFQDPKTGRWYFVYLEYGRSGSTRQVLAARMTFNPDGTIVPIQLLRDGVGALRPLRGGPNLALSGHAWASSARADYRVPARTDRTLRRVETFGAMNAIDGSNGTRWMAAQGDARLWLTVDLGKSRSVSRTEAYFVKPTAPHAYKIDYSNDGRHWRSYALSEVTTVQSPYVDRMSVVGRYFRITVTRGDAGLWEFRIY